MLQNPKVENLLRPPRQTAIAAPISEMSKLGILTIISGMILTGAIYGAILYITLRDSGVSQLIEAI